VLCALAAAAVVDGVAADITGLEADEAGAAVRVILASLFLTQYSILASLPFTSMSVIATAELIEARWIEGWRNRWREKVIRTGRR